jgi:hypothetical protein
VSAIDTLRDIVATHSNAEAILWSRAEFVAVLQEIDELQRNRDDGWQLAESWMNACKEARDGLAKYERALGHIASGGCTSFVLPSTCRSPGSDRRKDGFYEGDRWCEPCLAADALESPRFGRHIGAEIEDGNDLPSARIQGVEETFEWSDDVIAVTPEQLVRIVDAVRKAQKP